MREARTSEGQGAVRGKGRLSAWKVRSEGCELDRLVRGLNGLAGGSSGGRREGRGERRWSVLGWREGRERDRQESSKGEGMVFGRNRVSVKFKTLED